MKINNTLNTYKKSEKFCLEMTEYKLIVSNSEWSNGQVRLQIGSIDVMVDAKELHAAINNATNTGKFL